MSKRTTSENSDAVSLFPFLAVLLCTMGALLVLLVVMAQRVGKYGADHETASVAVPAGGVAPAGGFSEEAATLVQKLVAIRQYEQEIEKVRQQAEQQLQSEQARLSHLEEHMRRLEHELARLTLAAQQLVATEKNRVVDQEQAERQLAQLKELILETQQQLEKMRIEGAGKKSFAIVPYKGRHGTYRKPIYIECSGEGIVLQPEGIRLTGSDFLMTSWPGNPLAAAVRASREYYSKKAVLGGQPEPPDPYPLILIRPDGIRQYALARAAIQSWDSDFGYEFIDDDWQLEFPELPDPQLANAQEHALLIARDALQRRVQSAPSRFYGIGNGQARGGSGRSQAGSWGAGQGAGDSAGDESLARAEAGNSISGNGNGGRNPSQHDKDPADGDGDGETQFGALSGEGEYGQSSNPLGNPSGREEDSQGSAEQASNEPGGDGDGLHDRYAQMGGSHGAESQFGSNSAGSQGSSAVGGGEGGQAASPGASSGGADASSRQMGSIADSHGSNWAVESGRQGAVPIRRTIHLVVRNNRMALLPSRHETRGVGATGTEISLEQSEEQISEKFIAALRERMDDWGLAGSGLYWRPVLKLNMGPDAGYSAFQIMHLLKNSGVEVRLPDTAQKERDRAQR